MEDKKWYSLDVQEACLELGANPEQGLAAIEAAARLQAHGPNALQKKPPRSLFSMFIGQMKEILVLILVVAAVISGMLGEWEDAIVILVIVILNAVIGIIQENKAENALKALKDLTKPSAKVVRDGKVMQLSAEEVVPGDLILLDAGDSVPADLRLIEGASLRSNESALTGESLPVEKDPAAIKADQVSIGDRKNMLFMGATITGGRAKAIAVETGMKTQLGRIAQLLDEAVIEPTPLQQRLGKMGKILGIAAVVIVSLVLLIGLWRGENMLDMFMIAISLAVAAVPEGLPAVVTIVLALGVTRMSRHRAIIRKLPAVETLGTATVICSDKTGTLTKNEMTATSVYNAGRLFEITGTGYAPEGAFLDQDGSEVSPATLASLHLTLLGGLLNSDAQVEATEKGYQVIGDPTEGALVVAAAKAGLTREASRQTSPRIAELPFDSDRKMMTTFHNMEGVFRSFTKGAPDVVVERCTHVLLREETAVLDEEYRKQLLAINSQFASQGQRVLALASRLWQEVPLSLAAATAERELTFIGFFALQDPPRPEAKDAVARCHSAGIRTVMITGDHRDTAVAIARDLGILQPGDDSLTGDQLEQMNEEQLNGVVNHVSVFARVSPEHKLRIVDALKYHGHIVAMTGDGVNDAPALKRADIGAAMGISGTEVAKEASDMVLQDDNFATIVQAVEEGRTIYNNIRGSVQYLLSCNTGEIVAIFTSLLLGLGSPLSPIQILWLNLVTDGPPALALGLEPPQKGIMGRPPRDPKEGIFAGGVGAAILWQGLMIGLLSLTAYWFALAWGRTLQEAHTMAFVAMAMSQLVHSFNIRSTELSLFTLKLGTNRSLIYAFLVSAAALFIVILVPFLRNIFGTALLAPSDWAFVLSLSLIPLLLVEISKLWRRYQKKPA
ncbi:MAG: calcium-translocating P-type ATPase, SERCA-type [Desulfotomaculaceae bacterium]|nr:calcium-translocating P-type ATPase, SERCA-type [Desulfotomaculaceae bacterium]